MIIDEKILEEEKGLLETIDNAKNALKNAVNETTEFYKSICASLNDKYAGFIGKKVSIHTLGGYINQKEGSVYEGWFYGFETRRASYYSPYRPEEPNIILFKSKKDGTESKLKYDIYESIKEITKIELI